MKRIIISIIASLMILFVIWAFMICIRYNFNVSNVRFSLYRTFQQIQTINDYHFEQLVEDIKKSFSTYNVVMTAFNSVDNPFSQFFSGLTSTSVFLSTLVQVLISVFKYLIGVIQMLFDIIGILFNPITY